MINVKAFSVRNVNHRHGGICFGESLLCVAVRNEVAHWIALCCVSFYTIGTLAACSCIPSSNFGYDGFLRHDTYLPLLWLVGEMQT